MIIVLSLTVIAVLLHIGFAVSPVFAHFWRCTGGYAVRFILALYTSFIPVSLGEMTVILIPAVIITAVIGIIRKRKEKARLKKLFCRLVSLPLAVYFLFVYTFAAGFYTTGIGDYFDIETRPMSSEELYRAALICAEKVNTAYGEITTAGIDDTSMGMSYSDLTNELYRGFTSLESYGFLSAGMVPSVKPIVLSEPLTYTHISGIYTFFTGEANINVNYPDFIIPFTAAHEMSHQRGVSRENEANFVAFLVCAKSNEPYIRYSGYLNIYRYMANALYSVSPSLYSELNKVLDPGVRRELSSYSEFFDKYRENTASKVTDAVNDAYLNVMDGTGVYSYGLVVDLCAAYFLEVDN